jgi:hypothetical protein
MSAVQLYEIVSRAVRDALTDSAPQTIARYETEYNSNPFFAAFGVSLEDYIAAQQGD